MARSDSASSCGPQPKAQLPPVAQAPKPAAPAPEPTVQMPTMSATPSLNSVRQAIEELDDLSDTQTIRLLERHSPYKEGSREADVDEAIRVIKPEDAQSMAAIKNAVTRNAPVLFAVQLDWSVTPFDMSKVPPLAIFNAYTLYTTEANREGRTWYGLRLGFFSDAVSAKQVAYYVRSDFKTVSVVPVTTIEKERANDINAERSGILVHRADKARGKQVDRLSVLMRAPDDLVVDVGDVAHVDDAVATSAQPAPHHVEHDQDPRMTEVAVVVNGHPADVHADFARPQGNEFLLRSAEGVEDLQDWSRMPMLIVGP